MKLKTLIICLILHTQTFAAVLNLQPGESALIKPNTTTSVTCSNSNNNTGSTQCMQEVANLRVKVNQLQNDLHLCQLNNQKPKVWNCTYVCSGNNGMGSDISKAAACQQAKQDSGVQCAAQCQCEQE